MKSLAPLILLLAAPLAAQEPKDAFRFPLIGTAVAPPQAHAKLSADMLYVVPWHKDFFLLASPNGLVNVTKETGPITIRAIFADGNGKVQTRKFDSKFLYIVEAAGTGQVELFAIPVGVTDDATITRKVFDVDSGVGPRPPPPVNAVMKHITFIGAELSNAALAVNNDAELRTLYKSAGVAVHVLKANDPAIATKGMTKAVEKAGGAPCAILQDEVGNVIGYCRMESVQQVREYSTQFIRR